MATSHPTLKGDVHEGRLVALIRSLKGRWAGGKDKSPVGMLLMTSPRGKAP